MHDVRTLMDGHAQRYLVCEGTGDPPSFGSTSGCSGAFAFDLDIPLSRPPTTPTRCPSRSWPTSSRLRSRAWPRCWPPERLHRRTGRQPAEQRTLEDAAGRGHLPAAAGHAVHRLRREMGMAQAGTLSGDVRIRTPRSSTADADDAGLSTGTPYHGRSANLTRPACRPS